MKSIPAIVLFLCLYLVSYGQKPALQSNDTASIYYSRTNFLAVDSFYNWTFSVEKDFIYDLSDSLQPVAKLTFNRIEPINDYTELFKQLDTVSWKVFLTYKVYRLSDSDYCYTKSAQVRKQTNFVPPFAGGDYFIIGKFIFLNTDPCIACIQLGTYVDFCRPMVNALISRIDRTRPFSVEGIVRQFPMERVYIEPPSKRLRKIYKG